MKIYFDKKQKHIKVSFYYDAVLVSEVQRIAGARFSKVTKEWSIPRQNVIETIDSLKGYSFTIDGKVMSHYFKTREKNDILLRIRNNGLTETEKKLLEDTKIPFMDYQKIGTVSMNEADGFLLGDQPGLGKTLQTLGISALNNHKKVLILCPLSAKKTWLDEIQKWLPEYSDKIEVISGNKEKRKEILEKEEPVFFIANYEQLIRDLDSFKKIEWDLIAADEAVKISNRTNKTAINLKKIPAKKKIALTGTPISNSIEDLWSIFDWIVPGLLGTFSQFRKEYCLIGRMNNIIGYKNIESLQKKIKPYFLRRLKSEVLTELPPKIWSNIYVEFSNNEKRLYTAIQKEIKDELKSLGFSGRMYLKEARVKMIRLKQLSDSLELISDSKESSKLKTLKELLEVILAGDEKAIIFTQFATMAKILQRELKEYKPLTIIGENTEEERSQNQDNFNKNEENKLLIMTEAGNTSLNLQRAQYVIHYDLPWSIAATEQREDRAHRKGQKRNVVIYRLLGKNSIDEYILSVLFKKESLAGKIYDGSSGGIDTFSEDDIDKLLKTVS